MDIQKKLIPVNFTKGGNSKSVVVVHTMVGTLDSTNGWFNNSASGVSSHYGVDLDGSRVFQWVEENNQAWANGEVIAPTSKVVLNRPGLSPNKYTISIECADGRNPSGADRTRQIPVLVELIKDICERNSIPIDRDHIIGHREIKSTKTCPGNLDMDLIVKLAKGSASEMTDDEKRALEYVKQYQEESNYEGAVRAWHGAFKEHADLDAKAKRLDALLINLKGIWVMPNDADEAEILKQAKDFMKLEEVSEEYRESIEECVGDFPSDIALLEAHKAVRRQIKILTDERDALQQKLADAKVPAGYYFLKSWTVYSLLFKLYKQKAG